MKASLGVHVVAIASCPAIGPSHSTLLCIACWSCRYIHHLAYYHQHHYLLPPRCCLATMMMMVVVMDCVHMHRFHRLVYASVNRRSTLAGQATVQVQSMREMPEGAQKLNPWIFVQSTSKRVPSLLCSFVDYREICHFTAKISQTRGFNRL